MCVRVCVWIKAGPVSVGRRTHRHTHQPTNPKPPKTTPKQLDKEEAATEAAEAAGEYADVPRPGGARERIRAEIRKEDAEAYKRLANA